MNIKRIAVLVVTICLILSLFGCATEKPSNDNDTKYQTIPNQTQDNPDNQDDTPLQQPDVLQEPEAIHPLTGLGTTEKIASARPVAVMINNIHLALPQVGISEADVIYEVLEEGGITRLLCIYTDYENIPEIGSIRSARDYYIDISDAHGAIFVHCGGSTYAKDTILKRNTQNIDAMYMGEFYRSKERLKTMSYEHCLMISGEGLKKNIELKGYNNTATKPSPFVFNQDNTTIEGDVANHIEVPFSIGYNKNPYAVSFFDYDDKTKLYKKGHFDTDHIDSDDNTTLMFTNVVTLTCSMGVIPGDELGCIKVDFVGSGKGTYATGGKIKDIVWKKDSRTSSYTLYESDGVTPLAMNKGKSYIALVPQNTKIVAE